MTKLEELFYHYDKFTPPVEYEQLISSAHEKLIQELEKPHRKLILQIIDSKDSIMSLYAEQSFKCGFYLAYKLLTELSILYDSHSELEESNSE